MGPPIVLTLLLCASSAAAYAAVGVPPQVEHAQSEFRYPVGTPAFKLVCPIISPEKSMLMIEWFKDGEPIDADNDPRIKLSKNQRELKIKNVALEDSGEYECQGTNGYGHRTVKLMVHVYNPDADGSYLQDSITLTVSPKAPEWQPGTGVEKIAGTPIRLKSGNRLELKCPARGNPLPQIRWYKNNILLDEIEDVYSAVFTISHVSENTTASYRCVIENNLGSIDAVFRVHVERSEQDNTPTIDRSFNSSVKLGHTAQLQCKVKSSSSPFIKWFKEVHDAAAVRQENPNATVIDNLFGMMLVLLDQPDDVVTIETPVTRSDGEHTYTNRLIIPAVRMDHAGRYVCVVTSSVYMTHKTAQLDVIEDPASFGLQSSTIKLLMIAAAVFFIILIILAVCWMRCANDNDAASDATTKRPPPPQRPPPAAPHIDHRYFNCSPAVTTHNLDSYFPHDRLQPPHSATLSKKQFLHRGVREDFSGTMGRIPQLPTPSYLNHGGNVIENQLYNNHYRTLEADCFRHQENPYDSGSAIEQSQPFLHFREHVIDPRPHIPYGL